MKNKLLTLGILVSATLLTSCATSPQSVDNSSNVQVSTTDSTNDSSLESEIKEMYVTINSNKLKITLVSNSSVDALVDLLKEGDITYTANDYGDFEKVGDIGHSLPQNNTQTSVTPGDVILYQGTRICLYYGTNSWNFTRIGRIEGYSTSEMRELLGAGSGEVSVTLSLD